MGGGTIQMSSPPPDNTALIAMIKQQGDVQLQAAKDAQAAQERAMKQNEEQLASQRSTLSNQLAQQQFGKQNAYQQALDAAAKQTSQNAATNAAGAVIGGAIDLAAEDQERQKNLLGAAGTIPGTVSNMSYLSDQLNPILSGVGKTQLTNKFSMPSTDGINFGGY
jgi:hypothetical protein